MSSNMRGSERLNRAFSGIPTFLRADYCDVLSELRADVAVFGVPFDEGSPWQPGTRFAPRSLREHSMRFSSTGFYDIQRDQHFLTDVISQGRLVDVGDVDVLPTNVIGTHDNISTLVQMIRQRGAIPLALGGDHSVSYPLIRGVQEPVHVVQFDAHLDFAPSTHDVHFSNGQPFRHVVALEHVQSLTQVGIRSLRVRPSEVNDASQQGSHIIPMEAFRRQLFIEQLKHLPAGEKCYISIDIDVLDFSLVPGCASAEPNGMRYDELRDALQVLLQRMDIIGLDLVEVNPQLDVPTGATSYLAAHLLVETLGMLFAQRQSV
ncbi:agmatinase [Klebsiella sp. 2680]|uniref:agmatinase n=1 Tax=Klebsiella sp. 2680 TaxID=2018037 RepID=UPI001157FBF0|nr:agmatinase [Klebsiella sp. 2680]